MVAVAAVATTVCVPGVSQEPTDITVQTSAKDRTGAAIGYRPLQRRSVAGSRTL